MIRVYDKIPSTYTKLHEAYRHSAAANTRLQQQSDHVYAKDRDFLFDGIESIVITPVEDLLEIGL